MSFHDNNRTNVTRQERRVKTRGSGERSARTWIQFPFGTGNCSNVWFSRAGSSANYSFTGKNERGRVLRMKGPEGIKLCRIPALLSTLLDKRVARQIINLVAIFDTISIFSSPTICPLIFFSIHRRTRSLAVCFRNRRSMLSTLINDECFLSRILGFHRISM